jgi:hypothetical protein
VSEGRGGFAQRQHITKTPYGPPSVAIRVPLKLLRRRKACRRRGLKKWDREKIDNESVKYFKKMNLSRRITKN